MNEIRQIYPVVWFQFINFLMINLYKLQFVQINPYSRGRWYRVSLIGRYKINKFSQLLVFLFNPKSCLMIFFLFLLLRLLVTWSRSRCGFNLIWASIPTRSSSTWWANPDEVSMNLQPQLIASLRPTVNLISNTLGFFKITKQNFVLM